MPIASLLPRLLLIGASALLLSACLPSTSDDYAYIDFENDTDEPAVLHGCQPDTKEFGKDCEGNWYDGSEEPIRIEPGSTASTSMATGLSIWHDRKSGECFIVTGWNEVKLTVPISRGRPCDELQDDYQGGLCPESSSPDGWWHRDSEDGEDCDRKRRKAGLDCDGDRCVSRPKDKETTGTENNVWGSTPAKQGASLSEQAVIVTIKTDELDWDVVMDLEEQLDEALMASGAGELDGNDVGQGEYNIYMYGADADKVWEIADPVIRASGLAIPDGSSVLRRYGDVNNEAAREVRLPYPDDEPTT